MEQVGFSREIELRHDVDVLVAGGGPAGIAAALAAARMGCQVFLAEATASLGGMGTSGLVPAFMMFSDGKNQLAAGVGNEILRQMWQDGGKIPDSPLSIKVEVLKRVYDNLLTDAGVEFAFHTQLAAVEMNPDNGDRKTIRHVICSAKSGLFAIRAKIYIDGTGDGDLAAWAGAPCEKGDDQGQMMAGTLCSLWAGIDWSEVRSPDNRRLSEAFRDKVFTHEDRHLPGMWRVGEKLGGGNIGHTFDVDATDERSLTKALLWGRKSLQEYERYYKQYLDGYQKMELVTTGSLLGIRESRRVIGDYVLQLDDFLNRANFTDEIGRYCYPVDIHASQPSAEAHEKFMDEYTRYRYQPGESYGIPYRILTPKNLANVLVAGRCVSCDRYLQSSLRVMPGCYITGQAAGTAAALAVRAQTDTRGIAITQLQQELRRAGAYLPEQAK